MLRECPHGRYNLLETSANRIIDQLSKIIKPIKVKPITPYVGYDYRVFSFVF